MFFYIFIIIIEFPLLMHMNFLCALMIVPDHFMVVNCPLVLILYLYISL